MANFLQTLSKKAADKASRVYDQINPLDNGLSYNTRQITGTGQQSAGQQALNIANRQVVQPTANAASRAVNTVAIPAVGILGLGQYGLNRLQGNQIGAQNALNTADQRMRDISYRGLGTQGAWANVDQVQSNSFKDNFVKPVLRGTADIAPFAIPGGAGKLVAKPLQKALIEGGANAVIGAGTDAAMQYAEKGKINAKQVAQAATLSGAVGAAVPLAGGLKKDLVAAQKTAGNEAGFVKNPLAQAPKQALPSQPQPQVVMNRLTKGGKDGRQNISDETMAGIQGEHNVRNTKQLGQNAADDIAKLDDNTAIQAAYDRTNVGLGKITDEDVAFVNEAITRAENAGRGADAINLHDSLSEHLVKNGQTIQAASLLYRLSPQGMLYKGIRDLKKGGGELTPKLEGRLRELADVIKNAPDEFSKQRATAEFKKTVADNLPKNVGQDLLSIWKAGLLSGVKTQGGNFVSNGTFGALKKISDAPAALIDQGISQFTGKRTKTLTGRGVAAGTFQGTKSGIDTLKTGIDRRNIIGNKYELPGEMNFKNPVLNNAIAKPTNFVFRTMGAGDQPFYYAAMQNTLYDLAKAEGLNRGLKGNSLTQFMKNTAKNPTKDMAETAVAAAEKAVLGNDTKITQAISQFTGKIKPLQVLAPFTKVPTNFLIRTLDYTPLGAVKAAVKSIQSVRKGQGIDQRMLSEALGEATTGSAIIYLGTELANKDLLSGQYPANDAKEAQRWKAEGIQPNSVKVGNSWISLNYIGPAGLLLGAGKDFTDAVKRGDDGTVASITGLGKNLSGQSFLTGFSGFSNALNDPERSAKKFINSQAGSVVPAWSNDIANLGDNFQRDANSPLDAAKARTPGLRNTLPIKQDVYGNQLELRTDKLNFLANPLKPSDARTSDVLSEVSRLHNVDTENSDLQVTPTTVDKKISFGTTDADGKAIKTELTDKQRYDLQTKVGQATQTAWTSLIDTPQYKGLNNTDKAAALNKLRQAVTEGEQRRYAAENAIGPYDGSGGQTKKLSKNAQSYLDGSLDITQFAKGKSEATTKVASTKTKKAATAKKTGGRSGGGTSSSVNLTKARASLSNIASANTSAIRQFSNVNKTIAKAKVKKSSLNSKVTAKGIRQYSKGSTSKVAVTRKQLRSKA